MNAAVTSKEKLIAAARAAAGQEGLAGLSIRGLAARCKISVGVIYNYFPSKADLVVAVMEDFWREAFSSVNWEKIAQKPFVGCVEAVYESLLSFVSVFQKDWLSQAAFLEAGEKQMGRKRENAYFAHVQKVLLGSLSQDEAVLPCVFLNSFTQQELVAFVFDNMLRLLRGKQKNCAFLLTLLGKLLYNRPN